MATASVSAELKYRDGQKRSISVQVENNLPSLISGITELSENASRLLSELVERERAGGDCMKGDEDEDGEEEDGEEENSVTTERQPPAKRSKTRKT